VTAPWTPQWLLDLFATPPLEEGETTNVRGIELELRQGMLRARSPASAQQSQTARSFAFKWHQRATFESDQMRRRTRAWLLARYGDLETAPWWNDYGESPLVLDAGCGAGFSAIELFRSRLRRVRYIGMDISDAVDIAAQRFAELGLPGAFLQADLTVPPLPPASMHVIFSEGVLHHVDSPEAVFRRLVALLRPGGRVLFYVYRRKGPIREFTDDYVRGLLSGLAPEEAWERLMPLTKLGKALGDLHVEVEIPEDVTLLGIPAGRIDVQRLFYWHVAKAYHSDDLDLDELNHINYDWYAPQNAHRHTPEDVRSWCAETGLTIEREILEEAGITVVAVRRD